MVVFMKIGNISSAEQVANIAKNKGIANPLKVAVPGFLAGLGIALKTYPTKDTFEKSNSREINSKIFLNDVIQSTKSDEILKKHDFTQYGKKGIPLKYSRKDFVSDINKTLRFSHDKNRELDQYNLRQGFEDIDGIGLINPMASNTKLGEVLTKYYNNETTIKDEKVNSVMNKIVKGMPEFAMTIGKEQHGTHLYSVDIHTLEVLQKSLNHPDYEGLSDEGKEVLKLSVLMHDFGKNGKVITTGHAKQSKIDAENVLKNYDLKQDIKDRVINQVENHHWFENYNKGITNADDVKNIFKNPEDLKIAKIMAKGDLESISPDFHRYILVPRQFLSQKEFDTIFAEKIDKIQ